MADQSPEHSDDEVIHSGISEATANDIHSNNPLVDLEDSELVENPSSQTGLKTEHDHLFGTGSASGLNSSEPETVRHIDNIVVGTNEDPIRDANNMVLTTSQIESAKMKNNSRDQSINNPPEPVLYSPSETGSNDNGRLSDELLNSENEATLRTSKIPIRETNCGNEPSIGSRELSVVRRNQNDIATIDNIEEGAFNCQAAAKPLSQTSPVSSEIHLVPEGCTNAENDRGDLTAMEAEERTASSVYEGRPKERNVAPLEIESVQEEAIKNKDVGQATQVVTSAGQTPFRDLSHLLPRMNEGGQTDLSLHEQRSRDAGRSQNSSCQSSDDTRPSGSRDYNGEFCDQQYRRPPANPGVSYLYKDIYHRSTKYGHFASNDLGERPRVRNVSPLETGSVQEETNKNKDEGQATQVVTSLGWTSFQRPFHLWPRINGNGRSDRSLDGQRMRDAGRSQNGSCQISGDAGAPGSRDYDGDRGDNTGGGGGGGDELHRRVFGILCLRFSIDGTNIAGAGAQNNLRLDHLDIERYKRFFEMQGFSFLYKDVASNTFYFHTGGRSKQQVIDALNTFKDRLKNLSYARFCGSFINGVEIVHKDDFVLSFALEAINDPANNVPNIIMTV